MTLGARAVARIAAQFDRTSAERTAGEITEDLVGGRSFASLTGRSRPPQTADAG